MRAAVASRSKEMDYVVVYLDASVCRVHMPQDIFFGIASQVDWRVLARRFVLGLARGSGYRVEDINPSNSGNIFRAIAESNGLMPEYMNLQLEPQIQDNVYC